MTGWPRRLGSSVSAFVRGFAPIAFIERVQFPASRNSLELVIATLPETQIRSDDEVLYGS